MSKLENYKYIEVVFENCESIIIPTDRVGKMEFGELKPFVDYPFDGLTAYNSEYLSLDISYKNESDLKYNPSEYEEPLGMFIGNPLSNNVEDRPNILGRLMNHNDLVMIELLDINQKHIKNIYVPWHEEDEYNNRYMKVHKEDDSLIIEIKPE